MNKNWFLVGTTIFSSFVITAGCSIINAPSEVIPGDGDGGAGGAVNAASSSSGMGGGGTSSSSSGNMTLCTPGTQMPCYEGAAGTEGIGVCRGGMMTCRTDGSGYDACEGQVVNAATDDCATPLFDENCDGVPNDNCPGETLAIVSAAPAGYADEVRTLLMNTGAFTAIDLIDAGMVTPSLADLQGHTAVLVFSDKVFVDPITLGDVVAEYFDQGGRVVLAMFSVQGAGTRIQGKFGDPANGYLLINPAGALGGPADDSMGTVLEPQSVLMQGVADFTATSTFRSIGAPINGGVVVAQWQSGYPFIVRGTAQGRNRVDVNFYPPQTKGGMPHWTGSGAEILRNALLY